RVPEITMRSTFIVGFPGERDEHAAYLEEWIGRARLDRVGFFEYSAEEGTPAAELPNAVAVRKRRERLIRLREAARGASEAARRTRCGRSVRVLVEESRYLREYDEARRRLNVTRAWFGRSEGEAPGVDGGIYFTGEAVAGDFSDVRLTDHGAFDFFGTAVARERCAV
ncbi:MAG: 30S ribosomal protein S12 methylthiotransferase RimO, partial [Candidatus Eremiobacteraeota bacterium]|nr:30S ribosomal protein S12 methylthiotransferase RimO [Candidatus Eremiobacteraeota bacterium]